MWLFLGDGIPVGSGGTGPSRGTIWPNQTFEAVGSLIRWFSIDITSDFRNADISIILHSLKWVW
jgi:hypothetical protein